MAARLWERGSDDAYITYTSVRNLLEHGELTFNLGERVFAQSDPGTALLLALVSALGVSVPGAGTILTAACLIGAGLLLGKDPWRVLGAGLLLVTSPVLWAGQGLGPVVATVLLMASARLAAARPGVAGAVAAAAVWARPDALIGAGLVWVLGLGRSWRARARFAASCGSGVAVGLALAWWWWGRPLPGTFGAKQAFGSGEHGFAAVAWQSFGYFYGPSGWVLLAGAAVGLGLGRRDALLRWLGAWGAISFAFYGVSGLPYFHWYVAPLAIALLAAAGSVPSLLWTDGRKALAIGAAVALVWAGSVGASRGSALLGRDGWRSTGYAEVGKWLAAHSDPAATVSATEIGYLGYYSQRRIVDLVGLVTPENVPFVEARDQLGAFLREPTDYLLFHTFHQRGGTRPIVSRPWFGRAYRQALLLRREEWGDGDLFLFQKTDPLPIPGPRPPYVAKRSVPAALGQPVEQRARVLVHCKLWVKVPGSRPSRTLAEVGPQVFLAHISYSRGPTQP
jgi:hypothetical protein